MGKIKILGHEVDVIITSDKNLLDGDCLAQFNLLERHIAINDKLKGSTFDELFFHEVFEYILLYFDIKLEHSYFQILSSALWATLKDNGMLTKGRQNESCAVQGKDEDATETTEHDG